MFVMKNKFKLIVCCLLVIFSCFAFGQNTTIKEEKEWIRLANKNVELGFNLNDGFFYLKNNKEEKIVDRAYFQAGGLQSKDICQKRTWSSEAIKDELGKGTALTIKVAFENYADILWQVRLYDDKEYFIFNMGIDNDTSNPFHLMNFYPLISKKVYAGKDNGLNYTVLDGNGGGSPTKVSDMSTLRSFNNLLVKFGDAKQPNILVAGGITYNEFEKFVKVTRTKEALQIQLNSEDPVGKLIDPNQKYWMNEKFYLCFENENPFEALEKYANTVKQAQKIELNYYDFPTECLWYASFYNITKTREKYNNSKGAVEEMDNAVKSGITKYTKVAIRLVPDAYGANNQQGWWDDEHWAKYNEPMSTDKPHYTEPYLTTESWTSAIIKKGGYPFTYMQSGRRSEDLVKLHPEWMLFNDSFKPIVGSSRLVQELSYPSEFSEGYSNHWWTDKMLWGYDFTDPGFIAHMQEVYKKLKKAGIKGIFYDYPEPTAWGYEGGFENKYATTAWAYRQMFKLAYEGLGKEALLQERNIARGSDIALGFIASQRVWGDTDGITPEMVSRCGLRWYKNRVVINYDMDSKDPSDAFPVTHNDGNRSMLTMCYVTSARFLLGRSFSELSKEQLHDLSRTFPYHTTPKSARPIDAFDLGTKYPRVYDFEVNPSWHQVTFYNYSLDSTQTAETKISVSLSKSLNEGGLALESNKQYYAYDFWNDHFIGLLNGNDKLEQQLRVGETRMMALHLKETHPQFISTNRHIMQGYLDLKEVNWNEKTKELNGVAEVIGNDPFEIIIATNNYKVKNIKVSHGKATVSQQNLPDGISKIILTSETNTPVKWSLRFK
jgi:hypothetical protein